MNPQADQAEYIRTFANAAPCKIRDIMKKQIITNDNVDYLKRLVNDIHMEYVLRFLWYDGPKPESYFDEWDDVPMTPPKSYSGVTGSVSSTTRGESNWGSSASRKVAATETSRGDEPMSETCEPDSTKARDTHKYGRTLIQYCCYYNAHHCFKWLLQEIVRNYVHKLNEEQEKQMIASSEHGRRGSMTRQTSSKKLTQEGDQMNIIKQLLEYPSRCYCATNYVAVAAIRNSAECLMILLQYGGLDPNMLINSHGSTAAHLAAWKDNIECLEVLKSGCYINSFEDSMELDEFASEETLIGSDEGCNLDKECDMSYSVRTWSAIWNNINEQGDTPMHVAAREGSCGAMKFFLDLAILFAEREVEDVTSRTQCRLSDDGNIETLHIGKSKASPPVDFSLRNCDGMDVTAVAAQNNRKEIIHLLLDCIRQISRIVGEDETFHEITQSASDGLSTLRPLDRSLRKQQPQSQSPSARRRANWEPVPFLEQNHKSIHQSFLPWYSPSLNLNNPQEKNNHEKPIHVAARLGNVDVIKALCESDYCNTDARDSLGQTALHVAVLANRLEVIKFFSEQSLEHFKKFDVVDVLGRTPLYIACSLGMSSIARVLIPVSNFRVLCHEKRQSPDSPLLTNVARQPPLHAAVINNHVNTASVLLDYGVDVEITDVDGRTAINAAAKLGLYEMCQKLILHGADVNSRSSKGGPTPFQKAKKYKHTKVAELLYEFGAR